MLSKDSIIIVGARAGSKRIPGKNIKLLAGKPLISYTLETAVSLGLRTIVSTDCPKVKEISLSYGIEVIDRPPELAQDTSTDFDWISHLFGEMKRRSRQCPRNAVFLRPSTSPRRYSLLSVILHSFDEKHTSQRTLEPITEALEKSFRINEENNLIPAYPGIDIDDTNNPNQMFPMSYKANGYCDIIKPEVVLNSKSLYGNNIQAFITPKVIEIDTLEDFEYAEWRLNEIHKS